MCNQCVRGFPLRLLYDEFGLLNEDSIVLHFEQLVADEARGFSNIPGTTLALSLKYDQPH